MRRKLMPRCRQPRFGGHEPLYTGYTCAQSVVAARGTSFWMGADVYPVYILRRVTNADSTWSAAS